MIRNHAQDDEGRIAFNITKPFVPHVLDAELAAEHGWEKCDLQFAGDPANASEESPVILWVSEDINDRKMKRVINQHEVTDA